MIVERFAYDIPLPDSVERGIGVVGAGNIVSTSHLPAYARAGLRVVALVDRDGDKATALARRFDIPKVYDRVEQLLADRDVEVVDLAVPPRQQPDIALAAIQAGKHVQCHKPLALDFDTAQKLVESARRAGVKLAVNQNARWIPGIRTIKTLIDDGVMGSVVGAAFDLGWTNDWDAMDPDWLSINHITLRTDCVHHLDTCRLWLGEPEWVFATSWRSPTQRVRSDSAVQLVLRYPEGAVATIRAYGAESSGTPWAQYRLEGTEGFAEGEFGQYISYGAQQADPFRVCLRSTECEYRPHLPYTVVPHAFIATMAQLLIAIEDGAEAESSGVDNLYTLRLVEAAARSIDTHQPVRPDEIWG